jgi:phytoene synthase
MDSLVDGAKERIVNGSKSFSAAATLLPPAERASVYLLYSWCRHCDDVIDDEALGFKRVASPSPSAFDRLARLRACTLAALQGDADEPMFRALERVVHQHRLPARYPLELLDGMAMDASGATYETIEDTLRYCYHVAGVVGVMTAIILGVRDQPTLERACDLGIAFQLTNIARDVVADAERGRIYLPRQWLAAEGLTQTTVHDPERRTALLRVVEQLLDVSERYYRSASFGIARLPLRSAWAVATARRVYRGIGQTVRHRGAGSWDERIVTSRRFKVTACLFAAADAAALTGLPRLTMEPRQGLWTTPEPLVA